MEIAAHRSGNSWNGIRRAIDLGFDYIELDVHMTKDYRIVVQYSPFLRIGGKDRFVEDVNLSTCCTDIMDDIILLDDILFYIKNKIKVIIDIKKGKNFYKGIGRKLSELISEFDMFDDCWIISFDHAVLVEVKEFDSRLKTAAMYVAHLNNEVDYWKKMQVDGVEVCNDYLDENTANNAKKEKITLLGWCTNKSQELRWLIKLGVDVITIELDEETFGFIKEEGRK